MPNQLRKLAIDLYTSDERDLVKMAGVFSGLQKLVRRLYTKIFHKQHFKFEESNEELRKIIEDLQGTFESLEKSIASYDLYSYKLYLEELKNKIANLNVMLAQMQNNVQSVKEQAQEMAKEETQVSNPIETKNDGPDSIYNDYLTKKKDYRTLNGQVVGEVDAFKNLVTENQIHINPEIFSKAKSWLSKIGVKVDPINDYKLLEAMRKAAFIGTIKIINSKASKSNYNGHLFMAVEGTVNMDFTKPPIIAKFFQNLRYDPNHQRLNVTYFNQQESKAQKIEKQSSQHINFNKTAKHPPGKLGDGFYKKIIAMCDRLQMKPEDLLCVMQLESGVSPTSENKNGHASGLIQFMPDTLKGVGYKGDPADFRELSGEQQLPYVERHIKNQMRFSGGPFKSAAQYYVANFYPVALRYPEVQANNPAAVIVDQHSSSARDRGAYAANKGLDLDKDGKITLGDLMKWMDNIKQSSEYKKILSNLEAAGHQSNEIDDDVSPKEADYQGNLSSLIQDLGGEGAVEQSIQQLIQQIPIAASSTGIIAVYGNDRISNAEFIRVLKYALRSELSIETNVLVDESTLQPGFHLLFDKYHSNGDKAMALAKEVNADFVKAAHLKHPIRCYLVSANLDNAMPLTYKKSEQFSRMFRLNYLLQGTV